ncbi:MAG: 16S rRNA (adenine(1518)-N(6)/adenine(1519)-N(6))-dimethyltransferase RsmA [Acidobacteriaceae bacterium]
MPQRPKLGQNFLVSPTAQAAIADALGDCTHRTVVEIGPGRGAITTLLAPRARRLILIELDRDLSARLRSQFADRPSVEVLQQDILTTDLATLMQHSAPPHSPTDAARAVEGGSQSDKLLVVGNLPYYITSDILLHLFRAHAAIDRVVIMLQREVADRLAAHPGTRDYGLLSVTAQLYARVENLFTLPPEAFSPPPQVHSTVLRLTMAPRFAELEFKDAPAPVPDTHAPRPDRPNPGVPDPGARFLQFLRFTFAHKRKTLVNNLRSAGYTPAAITSALAAARIPPQSRTEQLDLPTLAALFHALRPPRP